MRLFLWGRFPQLMVVFVAAIPHVFSEPIFEKYFGYRFIYLANTSLIQVVRGALECEKVCLDNLDRCIAANVIVVKANVYSCEIFSDLGVRFTVNQLVANPGAKFIRRTGKLTKPYNNSNGLYCNIAIYFYLFMEPFPNINAIPPFIVQLFVILNVAKATRRQHTLASKLNVSTSRPVYIVYE